MTGKLLQLPFHVAEIFIDELLFRVTNLRLSVADTARSVHKKLLSDGKVYIDSRDINIYELNIGLEGNELNEDFTLLRWKFIANIIRSEQICMPSRELNVQRADTIGFCAI
jgi:hypothetical protein